ncbi:MAG: protein kinase [Bradymonadales bacterium]|nr:protein kinase [Bradymonadales bacterium]
MGKNKHWKNRGDRKPQEQAKDAANTGAPDASDLDEAEGGAPTQMLNVGPPASQEDEEGEASTLMLTVDQVRAAAPLDQEEPPEAATVMLTVGENGPTAPLDQQEPPEAATVMLTVGEKGPTAPLDQEEPPDTATVMLTVGEKGPAAPLDQQEPPEAATVMLTAPAGAPLDTAPHPTVPEGEEAATRMLTTPGGAPLDTALPPPPPAEAATVMLQREQPMEVEIFEEETEEAQAAAATMMLEDIGTEAPEEGATRILGEQAGETTILQQEEEEEEEVGSTSILQIDTSEEQISVVAPPPPEVVAATKSLMEWAPEDQDPDRNLPKVGERVIGRYEIIRKIGAGGFAVVYEAEDTVASGRVAIKILKTDENVDQTMADRFRQEVKVIRRLVHPNTIKVSDAGETEQGMLFMVMEYLAGTPLDKLIKKTGPMDPARVTHLSEQILKSLAEAHELGIIHRDLKPANVIIGDIGGEKDVVKVLDFGIAKAIGPESGNIKTKTGLVCCTPRYASPEILMGRDITAAADVYAMGMMMTEMLMGKAIVSAASDAEVVAYMLSPTPLDVPESIKESELGKIILKASAKSRTDRYQDAREMLEDFKKIDHSKITLAPLLISDTQTLRLDGRFDSAKTWKLQEGAMSETAPVPAQVAPVAVAERPRRSMALFILLAFILLALIAALWIGMQKRKPSEDDQLAVLTPQEQTTAETQAPERRRMSARELLEARLAASEYRTGDWLQQSEWAAEVAAGGPIQVAVTETGEQPERPRRGGLLGAILPLREEEPSPQELALREERRQEAAAQRLSLLYESAQTNQEALELLSAALETGQIEDTDRVVAERELVRRTSNLIEVMLDLDRCEVAERRVDQAEPLLTSLPDQEGEAQLATWRHDIEACHTRVASQRQEWNPREYLTLVDSGQELQTEAQGLDAQEDAARRRELLYRSIHQRQQAIELLQSAFDAGLIREEHQASASRDIVSLNQQILATMMDLDLTVAVEAQMATTLQDSQALEIDEVQELVMLQEQIGYEQEEAQAELEAEMIAAAQEPPPQPTGELAVIDTGGIEPVGLGETPTGTAAGIATGTGLGSPMEMGPTGVAVAAAPRSFGWDWNRYNNMVEESIGYREEAVQVETAAAIGTPREETPTGPAATINLFGLNLEVDQQTYQAAVSAAQGPEGTGTGFEPTGEQVATSEQTQIALTEQPEEPEEPEIPVYTVNVNIATTPANSRLYVDDNYVGRTPYAGPISSTNTEAVVTLRKTDYETVRFNVPMQGAAYQQVFDLRPVNPFRRTYRMGGRSRQP